MQIRNSTRCCQSLFMSITITSHLVPSLERREWAETSQKTCQNCFVFRLRDYGFDKTSGLPRISLRCIIRVVSVRFHQHIIMYGSRIITVLLLSCILIMVLRGQSPNRPDSVQKILKDVIVTASHRNEAIPSQQLRGKELQRMNSLNVADALRYFSGV